MASKIFSSDRAFHLIDVQQAVLEAQLHRFRRLKVAKKELTRRIIDDLGYVQIDTISVIERAHNHTLWNRNHCIDIKNLITLQSEDRTIFEYWGHAASFQPISSYRYCIPTMRRFLSKHAVAGSWAEKNRDVIDHVFQRITDEGPLSSRHFTTERGDRGPWWDWKPAKMALETLFWQGKLMVSERRSFQRVYDLTERVLPDSVDTTFPNDHELGRFLIRKSLETMVVASAREIVENLQLASARVITSALEVMRNDGEIVTVNIEGADTTTCYAFADWEPDSLLPESSRNEVLFLSPFDNLVIQRKRLGWLFGFTFQLECYLPATKRRYGYFSLPVLFGNTFVGLIDLKADRKEKTLLVRNFHFFEKLSAQRKRAFLQEIRTSLREFAHFNRCERCTIDRSGSGTIDRMIARALEPTLSC